MAGAVAVPQLLRRRLSRASLRICDSVMHLSDCENLEELWVRVCILLEDAMIARDLVSNARGLILADEATAASGPHEVPKK